VSRSSPRGAATRRRVGFLGHQLVEYVLGAALVAAGVRLVGSATILLVGLGVALMLLAALTDGPLGATHLISRRVHHVLDIVVAALLVISPLASLRHPNVTSIAIAELVALLLIRIERGTSYVSPPARPRPVAAAGTAGSPTPPGSPPVPPISSAASELAAAARGGAVVASAVASQLGPIAAKAAHRGAFHLGVLTATARRAARGQAVTRATARSAAGPSEVSGPAVGFRPGPATTRPAVDAEPPPPAPDGRAGTQTGMPEPS
jgi:hypothetical protein